MIEIHVLNLVQILLVGFQAACFLALVATHDKKWIIGLVGTLPVVLILGAIVRGSEGV